MPRLHKKGKPAPEHQLRFCLLPGTYAIVHLPSNAPVPDWATSGVFSSITRTPDELSIVCSAQNLPPDAHLPQLWACLKLEGPFPFSMTGVLLSFIEPLSKNGIPLFAVSTYDTDYVLVQQGDAVAAVRVLEAAGHIRG